VYFNKHSNLENAENDLWKHIEEMKKSSIQEILKLKKTLINWSQEIINSFTFIDG
jgi:transposase